MSEWISVRDNYPENVVKVLCFANDIVTSWCEVLYYDGLEWATVDDQDYPCIATHWMSLPEPPKN